EASAASERAAELARLRFTEGVTDFLQVLDAERTQLEAQDQLAQGRTDAATAYAALYRAVGGRGRSGTSPQVIVALGVGATGAPTPGHSATSHGDAGPPEPAPRLRGR